VSHFLEGAGKTISPEALKMLTDHDWPGNIRELDNEVKRLVLLAGDSKTIEKNIVSTSISGQKEAAGNGFSDHDLSVSENIAFDEKYSLYDFLAQHEKHFILKALVEKHGIKKHAAALLNIPESTLRLKMKQYNIELDEISPS
ncbi:MAG: helix-turn-helix domain-containing protein, partial [Candidatus Zixiibacteriota bacterium]